MADQAMDQTTDEYSVYVPDKDDAEGFPIDIDDPVQVNLIEETGMESMRARLWYFEPGEKVSYHYHHEQEEIFYVVQGTGQVVVGEDQEEIEVPEGGFFRPETTTPRQLRNDSDEEVVWLIIGAPPEVEAKIWDTYDEAGQPADDGEFKDLDHFF
ncbi:cupin domain-containing protein [Halobacterium sp. KA-6]|uniref:cupin domain-containing protein n=1 Tax=Halobacterium sp. KA-6 TaxID=2896368 RepID=UPI001E5A43D4|nr:cupin domain-containing protein [Halobacterium sp. KA-6]MCD2204047.1 cupin domain-containing protein [Halobacterium sp. KA-6]